MQITEFKARCIEALREVDRSRQPLVVTLRGVPLARVEPIAQGRTLGALRGELHTHVDLVRTDFDDEWDMNR